MKGKNKRSQIKRDVAAEIIYPTIIRFVIFLFFVRGNAKKLPSAKFLSSLRVLGMETFPVGF